MDLKHLFIPITKVDAAQRLVYGLATAEIADKANEVCDYASTRPYYEKWSGEIAKATDGKSLGNLRVMHGNVAAGKITQLAFNDDARQIEICAKIVDDGEWKKVEEGVYTGFSQGGKYVQRWKDPANPALTRYTAEPVEVSLVDVPCLASATFEMIKDDGTRERRLFKAGAAPGGSGARMEARESAPQSGEGAPEDYDQVWQSRRDGTTFRKKAELIAHHHALDADAAARAAAGPALDALKDLSAALVKHDGVEEAGEAVARAAPLTDLMKLGARNSKADLDRLNAIHDLTVALGVDCASRDASGANDADDAGDADMMADKAVAGAAGALAKVREDLARASAERDALRKVLSDLPASLEALRGSVDALKAERDGLLKEIAARVKAIEEQPAVAPPRAGYVVNRDGTTEPLGAPAAGGTLTAKAGLIDQVLETLDPQELALALIRKSHQNPQPVFGRWG